jgi:hypothetical protein
MIIFMKKIPLFLLLAAFMYGCQIDELYTYENAVMELETYGGLRQSGEAREVIHVEPGEVRYTVYDIDGEISLQAEKTLSEQRYQSVLNSFKESDFFDLNNSYTTDKPVADVGTAELSLISTLNRKTIIIDQFITNGLRQDLVDIIDSMQALVPFVLSLSKAETEALAEEWIRDAPTYSYDGRDLRLEKHVILETFPEQHILTYSFESTHAGYGDRSDQIVAQVITPHSIEVKIMQREITSAIIDDRWDELNQMMIDELTEFMFHPVKCVDTPWEEWYKRGNIDFAKEPTDQELITAYYSEKYGIEIKDFERLEPDIAVCQACEVCPRDYYYTLRVKRTFPLIEEGWER